MDTNYSSAKQPGSKYNSNGGTRICFIPTFLTVYDRELPVNINENKEKEKAYEERDRSPTMTTDQGNS